MTEAKLGPRQLWSRQSHMASLTLLVEKEAEHSAAFLRPSTRHPFPPETSRESQVYFVQLPSVNGRLLEPNVRLLMMLILRVVPSCDRVWS